MGIATISGYGQIANNYYKQVTQGKSQVTQCSVVENNTEAASDSEFYSYYKMNGQEFSVAKADTYSANNPIFTVKGTDKDGTAFEQNIDPRKVDPENASFTEFTALSAWLSESGEYDSFHTNYIDCPTGDVLEKTNYLHITRDWRDEQMDIGNMVGYRNAVKACSAISNFVIDQSGKTDYIEDANGISKAYLVDAGNEDPIIGIGGLGDGENAIDFYACYADDSTAENPIIEIHTQQDKDTDANQVYRIPINDVDPQNATQMEMFAFCSHADKQDTLQEVYSYLNSSYYTGFIHDFFDADTINDFTTVKQDWSSKLEEVADSSQTSTSTKWIDETTENNEFAPEILQRLFEERG